MREIKEKAKSMHLAPGSRKKKDLIRYIQEKEGNNPCFLSSQSSCDQTECCWRTDCKPGGGIN